jgi:hypothetical protein
MDSSLRAHIKRAIDNTASLDDATVAAQVLRDLTSAEKDELLANAVLRTAPAIRLESTRQAARLINPTTTRKRRSGSDPTLANWQRFCHEALLLQGGRSIRCGEATVADLRHAAQERRAVDLAGEASRWDRIADALMQSGCTHVEDMPPQVIGAAEPAYS